MQFGTHLELAFQIGLHLQQSRRSVLEDVALAAGHGPGCQAEGSGSRASLGVQRFPKTGREGAEALAPIERDRGRTIAHRDDDRSLRPALARPSLRFRGQGGAETRPARGRRYNE